MAVAGYEISSDPDRLDVPAVHAFLTTAYWSVGVTIDVVRRSIEHSDVFGVYDAAGAQVGFARVITDRATFAYLADVFVLPPHRGRGLARWLIEHILGSLESFEPRRVALATADAHGLYRRFGFRPADPTVLMTREAP
jgi:GNAT superfamily N-acetyltransferase